MTDKITIERERFEAWARDNVSQPSFSGKHVRDGKWSYNHNFIDAHWRAWQAARAAPPDHDFEQVCVDTDAEGNISRHPRVALRAALAQKAEPPSMPQGKSLALLDLDSVEHMQGGANGPTIRLRGFINVQTGPTAPQPPIDNAFVAEGCEQFSQPADIVNPISQQEPVAYRHSKTGQLYDSEEEVPLADGDEWAEPLYAAPAAQQAPAAWRQWSTKLHDWDYQTNRGDLRPDTPADPLFVAAAQLVPLTDEQRNDRIEAWSSQGWGDRLGEVVRICIAIERAVLEAQPADAQQEPVAWRVRAKTLEQLLTRAIDHVSYGSRRSYDGVGGYKMREAASHLLSEIVVALAAPPTPAAVPPEGGIVVSKNEAGQIVCVSRQDEDGQFLSIIAESADAVPPGYVLVPIEPTQKMEYEFRAGAGPHDRWFKPAYRAMIAAAGDKP